MAEFLWLALAAGLGVAVIAGPLGCFVVWKRMAYFGDTLAHSALLGVALGLVAEVNLTLSIAACSVLIALGLLLMEWLRMSSDTALGILAHASLAVGLIIVSLAGDLRVDLNAFLFGDLLTVSRGDVTWIWSVAVVTGALLWHRWTALLTMTVDEELARVDGLPVGRLKALLMLMLALLVATAIKVVGVLLITALLLIPAATAGRFSRSPERMAAGASALGMLAVGLGLWASLHWDTPTGPSIVAASSVLFLVVLASRRRA